MLPGQLILLLPHAVDRKGLVQSLLGASPRQTDGLLALRREQSLRSELFLAFFQQRHQRTGTRRFHRLDDQLVLRAAGIGRQATFDDDFQTFFRSFQTSCA